MKPIAIFHGMILTILVGCGGPAFSGATQNPCSEACDGGTQQPGPVRDGGAGDATRGETTDANPRDSAAEAATDSNLETDSGIGCDCARDGMADTFVPDAVVDPPSDVTTDPPIDATARDANPADASALDAYVSEAAPPAWCCYLPAPVSSNVQCTSGADWTCTPGNGNPFNYACSNAQVSCILGDVCTYQAVKGTVVQCP